MTSVSLESGISRRETEGATTPFVPVTRSLADLVGQDYLNAVVEARTFLKPPHDGELRAAANEKIDFFPRTLHERLVSLLPHVGSECVPPVERSAHGATSAAFEANSKATLAPRSGMGYLRIGEDGRLFLGSKAEHYHVPLGHGFPGYALIEHARQLGIPNATHNNTRGHITRRLEEQLVRIGAGIAPSDDHALETLLTAKDSNELAAVLNLETGSLAAEAALKMVLARFYQVQPGTDKPKYQGRIPVLLVLGDDEGSIQGNYHGTTLLTQAMRGMWPGLLEGMEKSNLLRVHAVRPNVPEDLDAAFARFDQGPYKIAGFFHELIMMNYAARRLNNDYVAKAYQRCAERDVPTVVDEIQTCVWSSDLLMFHEYGVKPSIVVLGKGFPGGEYASSRILFQRQMDCLPQFGALITNGQAELSALAYLVTLEWAEANAEVTRAVGDRYEAELNRLAGQHPTLITTIEGRRHLAGIAFKDMPPAKQFAKTLQEGGLDISVQAYKEDCPPCALTKLPLTMGFEAVDFVIGRMENALKSL